MGTRRFFGFFAAGVLWTLLGVAAGFACIPTKETIVPRDFPLGTEWFPCSGVKIAFQADGNLVVYDQHAAPIWNTGTAGKGATKLSFQADGNFVIYAGDTPLWHAGTSGNSGSHLAMQGDGNIVIYGSAGAVWNSGTGIAKNIEVRASAADKLYCYANLYVFGDGIWRTRFLASNGTNKHHEFNVLLTVPRSKGNATTIGTTLAVPSQGKCDGSCERIAIRNGSFPAGDLPTLLFGNAQLKC